MAYLTMTQIAGYAKSAGFTGDALIVAAAVAMAESSGNTSVVNSLGCVGLFQRSYLWQGASQDISILD